MLSVRCLSVCLSCPICNVGVLWPNGCIDQDEMWHAGKPRDPGHAVLDGDPTLPPPKGGISVVAKGLDGLRWHLVQG